MALTLCSNCRLPVHVASTPCPLCTAEQARESPNRSVPLAAAFALIATVAVLRGRRA
jgi:hypothetical protein